MTEQGGPALQAGEALVHIGPPETGTAAVQGAFAAARDWLAEHDVTYAGGRQVRRAVSALVGRAAPLGAPAYRIEEWRELASTLAAVARHRAVLSSAVLAAADTDAVPRLVRDLGSRPVRVVVTLRPLAAIMPSSWQDAVRRGVRASYDDWLRTTLTRADEDLPSPFWRRQRHDRLVERWAEVVGPENVTVIVPDENDPGMVLRSFESLVGLPDGFLAPTSSRGDARPLTFGEIELVRSLNGELRRLGATRSADGRSLRRGVVRQLTSHTPDASDQRIATPEWALERCAELGAEMAANIACSNVHLVGNIAELGRLDLDAAGEGERTISADLASAAVLASARTAKPALFGAVEHGRVADVTARELMAVLARRARRRIRRTLPGRRSG